MSTQPTDLYTVLGLLPDASTAQISHAYRALLRQHHPDTRTIEHAQQATASDIALQQILSAYAILVQFGPAQLARRSRPLKPLVQPRDADPEDRAAHRVRDAVEGPLVGDEACHAHLVASFTHYAECWIMPSRDQDRLSGKGIMFNRSA